MKKIFTLIAAMLLVPWVGWGQDFSGGDGTKSNPYQISSAKDLKALAESKEGQYFILTKNIDLNPGITFTKDGNYEGAQEWEPIDGFNGILDGKGKTISGVYVNKTNEEESGLFGSLGDEGKIQNLNVVNSYIKAKIEETSSTATNFYVGGIIGNEANDIKNCSFDGIIDVIVKENIGLFFIGGICGWTPNGTIESCYNKADINVIFESANFITPSTPCSVNGIGQANKVYNSYNEGNISVTINTKPYLLFIDGIAAATTIVESCYNTGTITVSGQDNIGESIAAAGISGIATTIKNCYNTGTINTNNITCKTGSIAGYDMGFITSSYSNNYYKPQEGLNAVDSKTETPNGITSATDDKFKNGYVAYELRKAGAKYGQLQNNPNNDATPVLLAFEENKGKEVYKRILDYSKYKGNATEATELVDYVNSGNLWLPELNENEGWYDAEGNLYTNESTLSPDIFEITLYAEAQTPHTITISEMEGGKVEANEATAIKGETITLTVTPNEGYNYIDKSLTVKAEEETITVTPAGNGTYTFIMPEPM